MKHTCVHWSEAEERAHLERVVEKIKVVLHRINGMVQTQFSDTMSLKRHLQDNRSDMDHIEKASLRQSIDHMSLIGEKKVTQAQRLAKLFQSPYFGRIDFKEESCDQSRPLYIGIHSFRDETDDTQLVHDWRAPVASMFYDFELGAAFFDAPSGRIGGEIVLKRQYSIKNGSLLFMLETSLNIHDEVLQQELNRASDDKMKNIVATIQRDQNAIIRNESTHTLIIQGAAGSGKTSIALHRIAFLLYKFKDSITSNEILIISPNKVFAHYISQVLPELGEQMIRETTMEGLADHILEYKIKFQSFSEQVAALLTSQDSGSEKRIRFKASADFLRLLHEYATHVRNTNAEASDINIGPHLIPAAWFSARFHSCGVKPYAQQINEATEAVVCRMKTEHHVSVTGSERARVHARIKKMFKSTNIQVLYKEFYRWLEQPQMFKQQRGSVYEYSDVFPLIYLKILLEGVKPYAQIKHLVIDEMQDYTPVQYRVISHLFPCKKTILGDRNQSVNPHSASSAEAINEILPGAECMYMNKSYRSTIEITRLAQQINRDEYLEPIERHGDEPDIIDCAYDGEEFAHIQHHVRTFLSSEAHSMGIICKTQRQADALYERIRDLGANIHLLNAASTHFHGGVIVATAHLAKGLEFDQVIVPFCTQENYSTLIDRHMLYVACTRAMHRLTLTYAEQVTPFLAEYAAALSQVS